MQMNFSAIRIIYSLFVNKMTHQSDVLLMFEREHYGDVAIQNPDELSQHVEIEGKVDHGEEAGALGHRGVDWGEASEEDPECEQGEEAGQEDIGLVHVPRLIQVVIPDDHDEDDETETEANEDDGTRHDGSEDVMGRHTAARHQSDFILLAVVLWAVVMMKSI